MKNYDRADAVSVASSAAISVHKKLKLEFLDKPGSSVLFKLKWPHMNQNPRYVMEALTFNQLSFAQFVGGECRTILKTNDPEEIYGRLRIMSKVAYLFEQCRSWDRARAAYFAILSSIEEGEAEWTSSFGHYDMMCPAPALIEQKHEYKGEKTAQIKTKTQKTCDYFCREFQKGDCEQQSPHKAWVRNSYEQVEHYCAQCYGAKMGKLFHVPGTDGCSQQK